MDMPSTARLRCSNQGFTLIEILVVVFITALLAAVLFPVFSRARENARRTSCQSNLKQLGLGFQQYTQDFDETMPLPSEDMSVPGHTLNHWEDMIFPYVKSTAVYNCPSDLFKGGSTSAKPYQYPPSLRSVTKRAYGSYAVNYVYSANDPLPPDTPGCNSPPTAIPLHNPLQRPLSAIADPTGTALVGDSANAPNGNSHDGIMGIDCAVNGPVFVSSETPHRIGTSGAANWVERHLDTINVLWVDGHVKAVKAESLTRPSTVDAYHLAPFTIEDD